MGLYLVTGAAGFIGSLVAKALIDRGEKVVTIDNLSTGYLENIPHGVEFIRGNCQDQLIVKSLANRCFDSILHIAGQSSGEISFDDPVYDLQTNAQSTLLLLKLAKKNNCRKFIYASSMSVYGDQPDHPVPESAETIPKSFYAVGKIASENYLRIFGNNMIDATALRLFNVYGPGQNLNNMKQGMISIYLAQALKDRHLLVKGAKTRYRDFVYIDDVVEAFLKALEDKQSGYKVYNVATGKKTEVTKLIKLLAKHLSFGFTVEYSDSTPGDQFGIFGDNSKIKKELFWTPRTNLDEGIENMVEWAKRKVNDKC